MAFNMPPGCSPSDIPGNRSEDKKSEAMWDELHRRFPWLDTLLDGKMPTRFNMKLGTYVSVKPDELYGAIVELVDSVWRLGMDEGYAVGYDLARAEEEED